MGKRLLYGAGLWILLVATVGCGTLGMAGFQMSLERYEKAIDLYEAHLRENPDSVKARNGLGFAYFQTGNIKKAVALLEEAHRMEPGNSFSALRLGQAYVNLGRVDEAVRAWSGFSYAENEKLEEEVNRLRRFLEMYRGSAAAEPKLLQVYGVDPGELDELGKTDLADLVNRSIRQAVADRSCYS